MLIILPLVLALLTLACTLLWWLRRPAWMGFSGKTLWDWLGTMMNATVLGLGTLMVGVILQQSETNRLEEASLQAYLDRIATLHLNADLPPAESRAVARAQTSAILASVNGERAGRVLRFLDELGTLEAYVASLEGARLAGAELKGLHFPRADFEEADLSGADMEYGDFSTADFEEADLRGTDLKRSTLTRASFDSARMRGAELDGADLRGADLSRAKGLKAAQLTSTCLDETTRLPEALQKVTGDPTLCTALDGS
ncbi:pentapeptide repeat-containing protein [Pseudoruegeria sp. SHC-113]|uniref:pentapeptide repeat-containing protein n=1 Tax=Pseudoruegeria sp. SHC-113 TaxID=2855439 RepID=UPI0021BBB640|nr:pentapeptide repeat-containing protein [Pseudoruegeria sp. SHC-113]MCT8159729.1 pentapeptide repeat-containing protein [Pseudoruegeria sp. SHC-113]